MQLDLTSLPSRDSDIRWHSSPSEDMHRRGTDTGPSYYPVRVVRTVEKTIPDVPFGPTERVSLTDNATAATSGLVLRLICVGPRSGHPALLLQRHVFPGRKRSYGEMHDGGRRGFRGGVRREFELCVNTDIRHLAALTHTRTNKQTGTYVRAYLHPGASCPNGGCAKRKAQADARLANLVANVSDKRQSGGKEGGPYIKVAEFPPCEGKKKR